MGLVDAEPASMNDIFIVAPEEGGDAGQGADERADPTAVSPNAISGPNQLSAPLSISSWMKPRYQSYVMEGLGRVLGDSHNALPVGE